MPCPLRVPALPFRISLFGQALRLTAAVVALGYASAASAEDSFTFTDGAITWVYLGTEQDLLAGPPPEPWVWLSDDDVAAPAAVEDSLRVTADGSVYGVLRVNAAALAVKLAADASDEEFALLDESLERTYGGEDSEVVREPATDSYEGWAYDSSLAWTADSCGGGAEDWVWNSESRNWVGDPMDNRELKVVLILQQGNAICSGVMVDSDSVLTAAHCLFNAIGNPIAVGNLGVCSHENRQTDADCSTVTAKVIASGYDITSNPIGLDFALLDLSETDITDGEFMALSSASDSVIEAAEQDNTSYPAFVPSSCGGGSGTSNVITANSQTVDDNYDGSKAFRQTGDITWTASDWFGSSLDGMPMQSGSPFYYFPSSGSTAHYVTAVLSRQREIIGPAYIAGPKVSQFKSFVEANK